MVVMVRMVMVRGRQVVPGAEPPAAWAAGRGAAGGPLGWESRWGSARCWGTGIGHFGAQAVM